MLSSKHVTVEEYLAQGCGRCPLFDTPACKVFTWQEILVFLRNLLLQTKLKETRKWGMPCYTLNGKNVLLLAAFKDYAALMFFKGALLEDKLGILIRQTENMQSARQIRFTNLADALKLAETIKFYLAQAIEIEEKGLKVQTEKKETPVPIELQDYFTQMPELKNAFYALTPGRQRGYLLHFSQAKQSKTRIARIEKHVQNILAGKGLME
jgi:uncharacterized protein YdeI (YjbR/CyaY-like superfamily)